ncbi:MAG: hypothetical protein F4Y14_17850 [Acidobacteria bacterium]|nr:hypothetical protein [Acidobacteriota bacterium]
MATEHTGEYGGLAQVEGDAAPDSAETASAMEFPGCDPVPMTWEDVWAYDGRIEYWDRASSTAQVLRDAGPVHESPPHVLSEILTRISQERGSRIRCYGAVYLMERDGAGRPRRVMVADQTIYLRPGRWKPSDPAIIRDEDPLPDVILEEDHTTDVRRNKLGLYESWGFPEVWVETPDTPAPSRPRRLRPGLTIYRLDEGRFRVSAESRAFPGWPAARIHASLNETHMSPRTLADLTRVGRRLGRQEGTTPDDDPQIGRHRRQAHGTGLRAGRAEGIAAQRALLGRLASRKFDPATAERLAEILAGVDDAGLLAEVGGRIIDCDDGAALLADVLMHRAPAEPFRPSTVAGSRTPPGIALDRPRAIDASDEEDRFGRRGS